MKKISLPGYPVNKVKKEKHYCETDREQLVKVRYNVWRCPVCGVEYESLSDYDRVDGNLAKEWGGAR